MNNSTTFGEGIIKTSARPLTIYVDKNGNEYICDKGSIDNLDQSRSFDDQVRAVCEPNPFDFGG